MLCIQLDELVLSSSDLYAGNLNNTAACIRGRVNKSVTFGIKHRFFDKKIILFFNVVSLELYTLCPTLLQFFYPFQKIRFVEVLKIGLCL